MCTSNASRNFINSLFKMKENKGFFEVLINNRLKEN